MEAKKINVKIVEDNRVNMANFGQLFGHRIYKAKKIATNLAFGKELRQANEENGLTTNRSPYRFKILPIDIVSLDLAKDVDGSNVIVINPGRVDESGESVEIRCPIDNSKFTKEVSVDNIAEAINKSDTQNIFFSNVKKLVNTLNPSNINEIARIDKLIEALKKQRDIIQSTMDYNETSAIEYYRQLDKKNEQVRVDINVNVD